MRRLLLDERGAYVVEALIIVAVFAAIALTASWSLESSFDGMSSRLQDGISDARYLEAYQNFGSK